MGGPQHAHCRGEVSPTGRVPGQSSTGARPPARLTPGRCSLFQKDLRCSRDSSLPAGMGSPLACWATARVPREHEACPWSLGAKRGRSRPSPRSPCSTSSTQYPQSGRLDGPAEPLPPASLVPGHPAEGGSRQDPQGTLASGPLAGREAAPGVLVGWMGEGGGSRAHLRSGSVPCKVRLGPGAAHPPWTWSVQRSVK